MSSAASSVVEGQLRLARAALEDALRSKVERRVESLLTEYPAVAGDPEAALELVYTEFAVREALGQNPDPAEWYARFPQWRTDLEQMFEVHRELKKEEDTQRRSRSKATAEYRQLPPDRAVANAIGEFEILGEVGRGGMGVVYKARQASLGRVVAVKVILAGAHAGALDRERFRREAETAARLDHPNIVRIFAVGEHDGRAYCAMEYVDGASLADLLDGRPWPTRKAAELVATVAAAAQHAHENGVVHRDLKPANILLVGARKQGAVNPTVPDRPATPHPSSGSRPSVKVVDFGLAKSLLDTDPGPSRTGDIIGTPAYMAPEQAAAGEIGPGTDVWGMGVTLYELLVGHPPFQGATTVETLEQVRSAEPVSPRRLRPSLPRDLEVICLKCLRKDARHRYPTASALAEDLNRFLRGEPILARPASAVEHLTRWCRRNPAVASLLACLLVVFVTGMSGIVALWQQADHERDQAVDARNQANRVYQQKEEARAQADSRLYAVQISQASLDLAASRPLAAEQILDECMARSPELCGWEWHYLKRRCRTHVLEMPGHTQPVNTLVYSPDGSWIASGAGDWNGTEPGEVKLWDAKTGKHLRNLSGPEGTVHRLAFHPNGEWLFAACMDGWLYRWNLRDPDTTARRWKFASGLFSVAVSPNGKTVAVSTELCQVCVADAVTGDVIHSYTGPGGYNVYDVAYSPDGTCLASACRDGRVTVRATDDFRELHKLYHPSDARRVLFTHDNRYLVSASYDGEIIFWDRTDSYRRAATQNVDMGNLNNIACRPDGWQWACCTHRHGLKMWWTRGQSEAYTPVASGGTQSAAFSPDARWMAVAQDDFVIRVWSTEPPADPRTFAGPAKAWISSLAVSPDGTTVAVGAGQSLSHQFGDQEKTIRLYDLATDRFLEKSLEHDDWLTSLAFHPSGRQLIAADRSGAVKLWDVQRQVVERPLQGHRGAVHSVAYRPEGKTVATAGADNTARLWDISTGTESRKLPHPRSVLCVAFNSDGRLVATGCADHVVRVWEVESGRLIHECTGHKANVTMVAFRPNSPTLASADEDQGLRFWDAETGKLLSEHAYDGHENPSDGNPRATSPRRESYLSFSHDGRRLAFGSTRGATQIWDADGRRRLLVLGDSKVRETHHVAFAAGGGQLVTTNRNQVRVWETQPQSNLAPIDRDTRRDAVEIQNVRKAVRNRDWHTHEFYADLMSKAHPEDAIWLARRGMARTLQGRAVQGDADHFDAVTRMERSRADEATKKEQLAKVWYWRGEAFAHLKKWAEAEEAHRETTRIAPDTAYHWWNLAETLLAQNKLDEYRACCAEIAKRFDSTDDPDTVKFVVAALTTLPEDAHRETLLRLSQLPDATFADMERLHGALLFRVGQYQDAITRLKATEGTGFRLRGWDMVFRAMAYHKLNRPTAAREWLKKARDWIAEADRVAITPTAWSDFTWVEWNEELETRILLKEAEAMLKEGNSK